MKILSIMSGGIDSTVMTHLALSHGNEVEAVNFKYPSKHNTAECAAADELATWFNIPLHRVDLSAVFEHHTSALLNRDDRPIPEAEYNEQNMHQTVVPFRNGIMIAVAAGIAESKGLQAVAIGAHAGDHTIYPDCRPAFTYAIGTAVERGTKKGIVVIAPLLELPKSAIVRLGARLGSPFHLTWSCYKGEAEPCGKCGTCIERKRAFEENELEDPAQTKTKERG